MGDINGHKDGTIMARVNTALAFALLFFVVGLAAQPRLIDRKNEAKLYPDLQVTERVTDGEVLERMKGLSAYGHLVDMARVDRKIKWQEDYVDPQKFENTFRLLKFTPRNMYVRYVEDVEDLKKAADGKIKGNFLLAGMGPAEELHEQLQQKVNDAKGVGIKVEKIAYGQGRTGIELTQFDFIYGNEPDGRKAVGSLRKSLTLLYSGGAKGGEPVLNMVVATTIYDHLAEGVTFKQVIVDPSPLDTNLDDIIIYDRYNQKPTSISVLGMMSNTPNDPHRVRFKKKFYTKYLSDFYRMYRMVDSYAKRDGGEYNREVIEKLEDNLGY